MRCLDHELVCSKFCCAVLIGEILAALGACPVFDVTIFCTCGILCFCLRQLVACRNDPGILLDLLRAFFVTEELAAIRARPVCGISRRITCCCYSRMCFCILVCDRRKDPGILFDLLCAFCITEELSALGTGPVLAVAGFCTCCSICLCLHSGVTVCRDYPGIFIDLLCAFCITEELAALRTGPILAVSGFCTCCCICFCMYRCMREHIYWDCCIRLTKNIVSKGSCILHLAFSSTCCRCYFLRYGIYCLSLDMSSITCTCSCCCTCAVIIRPLVSCFTPVMITFYEMNFVVVLYDVVISGIIQEVIVGHRIGIISIESVCYLDIVSCADRTDSDLGSFLECGIESDVFTGCSEIHIIVIAGSILVAGNIDNRLSAKVES